MHKPKSGRELGIPVTDQEAVLGQEAIDGIGQTASDLGGPLQIRLPRLDDDRRPVEHLHRYAAR